jgi:hypothetical protein
MTNSSKNKKKLLSTSLVLFVLLPTVFGGVFGAMKKAHAFDPMAIPQAGTEIASGAAPGLYPNPAEGTAKAMSTIWQRILSPSMRAALLSALLNVFTYALDRVAYEAATAIATGGEGQAPLFYDEKPSDAWKDLGLDMAGEAFYNLTELLDEELDIAFDLCMPGDPFIKLSMQLGIQQYYQPREPQCEWEDIANNWSASWTSLTSTITDPDAAQTQVLAMFAEGLRPGNNEVDVAIRMNIKVNQQVAEARLTEFYEQAFGDSFKDKINFITGKVETPSDVLASAFDDAVVKADGKKADVQLKTVLADTNLLGQLGLHVASTFTNTLLSTLMSRLYNGLFDVEDVDYDPFDSETVSIPTIEDAQERFSSIITTSPISLTDYNALTEFVICPTDGVVNRSINNCVFDANFAAAVARGATSEILTVQEAIDEGYLNGSWPLIPPESTSKNQDPFCYSYGYCYTNLVKLRKARILPTGWEIAASRSDVSNPATLQEVVDAFDDCSDDGTLDGETYKWCHLIDPNWVIKYPETQCRAEGFGEILATSMANARLSSCVDTPSCISEDDDGQCDGGYGYCVREKNTWRFRGDDCPEQYATCLSFSNTNTGGTGDYLLSTVDYADCTSDNAGCRWYSTTKHYSDAGTADDTSDDTYEWLADGEVYNTYASLDGTDHDDDYYSDASTIETYAYTSSSGETYSTSSYVYDDRLYLTHAKETCDASDAGCTELYEIDEDLVLNLVMNSSFEDDEDADGLPDYWQVRAENSGTTYAEDQISYVYDESGDLSYASNDSFAPGVSTSLVQEGIFLKANTFYTFSYYYAYDHDTSTVSVDATANLQFVDLEGEQVDFSGLSYSTDTCTYGANTAGVYVFDTDLAVTPEDGWLRAECTFTTPEDVYASIHLESDEYAIYDAVQLEYGETAGDYAGGYNESSPTTNYIKVAPDYLGCSGAATDPIECDSYAQVCSAVEVGCHVYTPSDGDPDVPAIASSLDECPSECTGYTTYKQEETLYDSEDFPIYFIADGATQCSSQYVGCDGFTNLETEETEYYTYLRSCLTETMADGTAGKVSTIYYTWEGSDNEGYQLVTWNLLESNGSTAVTYTQDDDADGAYDAAADANPASAPCTNWEVTSETEISCNDDDTDDLDGDGRADVLQALEDDDTCNEHADIFTNSDCREFFDEDGNVHYRLWTETISVTDSCTAYRINDTDADNCSYSGGYETASGVCRYFGYATESTTCSQNADGCREYTGGAGRNSTTIFEDYLEDDTTANFTSASATLTISEESLAQDGHSLRIAPTTSGESVSLAEGSLSELLVQGKTFVLSFWAKGSGDIEVELVESAGTGTAYDFVDPNDGESDADTISLDGEWQLFELGPLDTTTFETLDDTALVVWTDAGSGSVFYLDNVILKQVEENITVIKDSWVIPATCDTSPTGVSSDQYYLGCEEYTDEEGELGYYYRFSDLCSEEAAGCQAYYDTQNSSSEYGAVSNGLCFYDTDADLSTIETAPENTSCEIDGISYCTISSGLTSCHFDTTYNMPVPLPSSSTLVIAFGAETQVVTNDVPLFIIDDGNTDCSSGAVACEELGEPTYAQDQRSVESYESVYYINDPDDYGSVLCEHEELFCEEWDTTQDGNYYFKDPVDKTCDYESSVVLGSVEYYGWFRSGTEEPCHWEDTDADGAYTYGVDTAYLISGEKSGAWYNGDDDYDGWVAACESKYDLCSEFIDPTDTAGGLNDRGVSYYYINDELLSEDLLSDTQRCDGAISQKAGCVLFNDTTDSSLNYNAAASYLVSVHADELLGQSPNDKQDPINCEIEGGGEITTPEGAVIDLCGQRCFYTVSTTDDYIDTALATQYGSGTGYFERSCLSDDDCATMETAYGAEADGTCMVIEDTLDADEVATYTLFNDTNTILKVNRDRECAAWLTCSSSQTSWSVQSARYETVCNEVSLCKEFNSLGDSSFCSEYLETDPTVLNAYEYSLRDITWSGWDYSGYAIPDQLPVEHYGQYNVAPSKVCQTVYGGYDEDNFTICSTEDDCEGLTHVSSAGIELPAESCTDIDPDYRLGYLAGGCDADAAGYGGDCYVGFCEDSGVACEDTADCASDDTCVVGYCQSVSETECTTDADCASAVDGVYTLTPTCDTLQRMCVDQLTPNTTPCGSTSDCALGACVPSAGTFAGSCFNNSCLTDIRDTDGDGVPDQLSEDQAREKECRGYPESTSPFGASEDIGLVEYWRQYTDSAFDSSSSVATSLDAAPYTMAYGYQNAEVCAPSYATSSSIEASDDCMCSYQKAEYGDGYTHRYYGLDYSSTMAAGFCLGGSLDGKECSTDEECNLDSSSTYSTAYCQLQTRLDTVYGWEGYCLERDTAIQLYGSTDSEHRACLTWLPVDQLAGSTDLYGKYTEAGHEIEDAYYCGELGYYVDAYVSNYDSILAAMDESMIGDFGEEYAIACADIGGYGSGDSCGSDGEYEGCIDSVECPDGYFALLGSCADSSSSKQNQFAYYCRYTNQNDLRGSQGDSDCPYMCIPKGSVHLYDGVDVSGSESEHETGEACLPPDENSDVTFGGSTESGTAFNGNIYVFPGTGGETFTNAVKYYVDCALLGIDLNEFGSYFPSTLMSSRSSGSETDHDSLNITNSTYFACESLVQVNDEDLGNKAWTDRLWAYTEDFSRIDYDSSDGDLGYDYDAVTAPYGVSIGPEDIFLEQYYTAILGENLDVRPVMIRQCADSTGIKSPLSASESCAAAGATAYSAQKTGEGGDNINTETSAGFARSYQYAEAQGTATIDIYGDTDDIAGLLGQIFAKSYGVMEYEDWDQNTSDISGTSGDEVDPEHYGVYEVLESSDSDYWEWDYTSELESGIVDEPTVVSVGQCKDGKCEEDDAGKFSVNEQDNGTIYGSGGNEHASVTFFAYADENHMPIKNILVDWGDGDLGDVEADEWSRNISGSVAPDNYYKNYRGLEVLETGIENCKSSTSDADHWGVYADACMTSYLNFTNDYNCTLGDIYDMTIDGRYCEFNDDGNLEFSPCIGGITAADSNSCVFQPRVFVKDNWGWCTGTCESGYDSSSGCYDAGDVETVDDHYNECDWDVCPGEECGGSSTGLSVDPWVYYDGWIEVSVD